MLTIFRTFFALGWVSFGGPAAHIGYFRHTFVEKLRWVSEQEYAQFVALSQFLPGPGSSQVGFAIGYHRGGLAGAWAAFLGFTLPSVLIMLLLAGLSSHLLDTPLFEQMIHGLKLLAIIVVADACLTMYRNFCQQRLTAGLCVLTAVAITLAPGLITQFAVLLIAAFVGQARLAPQQSFSTTTFSPSWLSLLLFASLLLGLPLLAASSPLVELFGHFFQAGSLVFGGGHVVLPLLQNALGDSLSTDQFLTGYAAAQAVPGPMFTLATYLGYVLTPEMPVVGALIATLAVFLPGFLLLLGVLKNWSALAQRPKVAGAMQGVNACVVGLLLAALYQPVWSSTVHAPLDWAALLVGFFLFKVLRLPLIGMVGSTLLFGVLSGLI
ncbi:TPA: chromate efflux transporter [Vibrio cholerae]|uniref:Chromate resistance protein-related protein n=9 Tax=Vibrio cholerae TaxID=666 RepID=Q9KPM8_VIBCH|nr:chromate efflux transporter [Vibrio cholerae]EAZ74187.1 transporter, putative [Vibrio cholerae NCTC 8457]AAF95482.1 chromate resistance protein-related protein [Vibrio cholerae O1 biovar El Tor str. N16961]ABQ21746.1 putative transporter [Vibrio cholerae O395]ACP06563.1 chromate resistance protein-related protein [Vibrio cholerae M66-2]ACP10444.1 chromate resistance protein-related protein [Vibrio cholerae O395]